MQTCTKCGSTAWLLVRQHTLWETFTVEAVQEDGSYEETGSDFGDTIRTSGWLAVECAQCAQPAPAEHPLWPQHGG